MITAAPHFHLYSQARQGEAGDEWSFVLQAADGSAMLAAHDLEPDLPGERIELLAVVRGLEALDQPSRVTLHTRSRYVLRGLAHGLDEWRDQDWTWERDGQAVPVKHGDLWRRLDRALAIHRLQGVDSAIPAGDEPRRFESAGRSWRIDAAHEPAAPSRPAPATRAAEPATMVRPRAARPACAAEHRRRSWVRWWLRTGRSIGRWGEWAELAVARLGTPLTPRPWLS